MRIDVPELCLVVLIGASGSGKSTFAARHFLSTEILSSDEVRALIADDPNDQAATSDAFEILHTIAAKRLERGRLTVVDATNVQKDARAPLVDLARRYHCLAVAIILDLPESVCAARNRDRTDRNFGSHVIRRHRGDLKRSLKSLSREGFRYQFVLDSVEKIDGSEITRVPLWTDKRAEHGPFDIIGDVHGCAGELEQLLRELGYEPASSATVLNAGLWDTLATDWLLLDCEIMPWSAKAQGLLRGQYAAVGSAGKVGLGAAIEATQRATDRLPEVAALRERLTHRLQLLEQYIATYRAYCWPVATLDDYKLAPFHLLASEGHVHSDKDHAWHMDTLALLASADPALFLATDYRMVDLADAKSVTDTVDWWLELTVAGGEGMVVKPQRFIGTGKRGAMQPAVKCRGREYLRIIYGPEYTDTENLSRLRARGLRAKRSLALREFALGIESMERFVRGEPLRRVHECVFAVLGLESEPVDPRL